MIYIGLMASITAAEFVVYTADFKALDGGTGALDEIQVKQLLTKQFGKEPSAELVRAVVFVLSYFLTTWGRSCS